MIELAERLPDDISARRLVERLANGSADLVDRGPAVAVPPHRRGRRVQRMGAMLLEVVDEKLVIQLLDPQAAYTSLRK